MTRSIQTTRTRRGARAIAACAALAAAGATLPMIGVSTAAAATTSCAAPSGLASDDALRGPAAQLKDVRLAWQPVAGAAGYELEVSPDQDFSNNIFVDTTTVSTRYNVPPTVLKPSSYFWRVRVAGASCWSDDGGSNAAQFSVAWTESPVAVSPSGTVSSTDLNFAWNAIPEASAYEVELTDATTGELIGRCITTHNSFAPYDEVSGASERIPVSSECIPNNSIGFRRLYSWRVRGLDTTGTALDGKPYPYVAKQANVSTTTSGQRGTIVVNHVYSFVNNTVDTTDGTIGSAGSKIAIVGLDGGSALTTADTVTIGGQPATSAVVDPTSGDLIATVPKGVPGGVVDTIITDGSNSNFPSASDQFVEVGGSVSIGANETFPGTVLSQWSAYQTFQQMEPSTSGGLTAPSGLAALLPDASGHLSFATCSNSVPCVSTPTLHWNADPGATSYRVYLWDDQNQSSLDREYETTSTYLTPRDELLDDQAGQAYYWQVQSCSEVNCGTAPGNPNLSPVASFSKDAKPVTGESPRSGATVNFDNVVLSWQHWQTTEGTGLAAAYYHVQIATSCTFDSGILDDGFTDVPEYVNPNVIYPNGTYFWRVQAVDGSSSPLAWDAPNHTTNNCSDVPSFTLNKQLAGASPGTTPSLSASALTIDATDKSIIKSGKWVTRKASGATKGTALVTSGSKKQSLSYSFERGSVTVGYCTGPMDGQLSIYVDGKLRRNINTYKRFTSCKATFLVGGLSKSSKHKLVVQARDKKGFSHGTPQVVVDYIKIV